MGRFWTRVCFVNLHIEGRLQEADMIQLGTTYGRALQLVNILRDLPRDLQQGRCYLPLEEVARAGLTPADLLDPNQEAAIRPVYNRWLERALSGLEAGWTYTCAYPRGMFRLRFSCALPVLIGFRTLQLLARSRVLNPAERVRVSRGELRRIILGTALCHPFQGRWKQRGIDFAAAARCG